MKYMVVTEFNSEDWEAAIKKNNELIVDDERNPGKYPKKVTSPLIPAVEWPRLSPDSIKVIEIVEADSVEQKKNNFAFWTAARISGVPSLRKWYVPLLDDATFTPKGVGWLKK
jgi:hypothetical protein